MTQRQQTKAHDLAHIVLPTLSNPSTDIRLLQIEPADFDDEIRCTILAYPLSEAPEFAAISYTWGPELPQRRILLNGKLFLARQNCHYAIQQARRYQSSRPIWVDSICIDQNNVQEKNAQVAFMGDIYTQATEVVACIGPSDAASDSVFKAAREMGQFWSEANPLRFSRPPEVYFWKEYGYSEDDRRELQAMRKLFCERPYFQRVWIVQELYEGGNRTTALCGLDFLDWTLLTRFDTGVDGIFGVLPNGPATLNALIQTMSTPGDSLQGLPDLLRNSVGLLCMDPRDRVYGMVRLLGPDQNGRPPILPDYGLSHAQLALKLIRDGHFLDVMDLQALVKAFNLSEADITHELAADAAADVEQCDWILGQGELLPIRLCHYDDARDQLPFSGSQKDGKSAPTSIHSGSPSYAGIVRFHANSPPAEWSSPANPLYGSTDAGVLPGDLLVHAQHFDVIVRLLEYPAQFLVVGDATVMDEAWDIDCCREFEQADDTMELPSTVVVRVRTSITTAFALSRAYQAELSDKESVTARWSRPSTMTVAARGSILYDERYYRRLEKQRRSLARELSC